MSNTGANVHRLEKIAHLGGLSLLAVLGVVAAILASLSIWAGAVACLGLGLALLAPLQFVQARRQLRTLKTVLRQAGGALWTAGVAPRTTGAAQVPAQGDREVVALLSRNNRHIVSLAERIENAGTGAAPSVEMDRLIAETAALRSELLGLRTEQEQLRGTVAGGWSAIRADLHALSVARGTGSRVAEPGQKDGQ